MRISGGWGGWIAELKKRLANLWGGKRTTKRPALLVGRKLNGRCGCFGE
jgi:hypothetical protein